jgi:hypothetical protein
VPPRLDRTLPVPRQAVHIVASPVLIAAHDSCGPL